jgi:hypothetical protein
MDEPYSYKKGVDVELMRRGFKFMTNLLDKGRDESFVDTYPYYSEWYESITGYENMNLKDIF